MEERPSRLQRIRSIGRSDPDAQAGARAPARTDEPHMPLDVVRWLEEAYPDRMPPPYTQREHFVARAAEVDLVRRCRALYQRQEAERLARD